MQSALKSRLTLQIADVTGLKRRHLQFAKCAFQSCRFTFAPPFQKYVDYTTQEVVNWNFLPQPFSEHYFVRQLAPRLKYLEAPLLVRSFVIARFPLFDETFSISRRQEWRRKNKRWTGKKAWHDKWLRACPIIIVAEGHFRDANRLPLDR